MLKASVSTIGQLLGYSPVQYIVPSFQRPYVWAKRQWEMLWKDLAQLYGSKSGKQHFFGTLITLPTDTTSFSDLHKCLLVDGQQRLITVCILLAAIRDTAKKKAALNMDDINNLLFLRLTPSESDNQPRLLPIQQDRESFANILLNKESDKTSISKAYSFYKGCLEASFQQLHDFLDLTQILLAQFVVIHIEIGPNEDPYPIYASLNTSTQIVQSGSTFKVAELAPEEREFLESQLLEYRKFKEAPELMAIIAGGESAQTEFKEAACLNPHTGKPDNKIRDQIVKAVAAFMNTREGGVLLIGVADNGDITGVDQEYSVADKSKANWDGYNLFISNVLNDRLAIENPFRFFTVIRYAIDGKDVCCIRVEPATAPVYVEKKLFVRFGNQSVERQGPDLVAYIKERWG
jgi:hypothetical protein